jgi:hypothetical protein
MGIEVMFSMNRLKKRVDILIYDRAGQPLLMVECKAPDIPLNDKVFDQIVIYNMEFKVPYIIVTNGMDHYICKMDHENKKYDFLLVIPLYEDLLTK